MAGDLTGTDLRHLLIRRTRSARLLSRTGLHLESAAATVVEDHRLGSLVELLVLKPELRRGRAVDVVYNQIPDLSPWFQSNGGSSGSASGAWPQGAHH